MEHAGNAVAQFLAGKTLSDFESDLMLRSAVERQLFIVGEALAQLSRWDPILADSITDRRSIIAFRNMLAHGYSDLVDERVFSIATGDLPALLLQVQSLS